MNDSEKPFMAFFVYPYAGEILVTRRGTYTGLPGDYLRLGETISDCARRVLRESVFVARFGHLDEMFSTDAYEWDGKPVSIHFYSVERSLLIAPHFPAAFVSPKRTDVLFDITVTNLSAPRQKRLCAAPSAA